MEGSSIMLIRGQVRLIVNGKLRDSRFYETKSARTAIISEWKREMKIVNNYCIVIAPGEYATYKNIETLTISNKKKTQYSNKGHLSTIEKYT